MLFLSKMIILHIIDCFEDHTTKKKKKFATQDVTNFSPIDFWHNYLYQVQSGHQTQSDLMIFCNEG